MSNSYPTRINSSKPVVLITPLDWGLGHATRCIPIIRHLLSLDCQVIIGGSELTRSVLQHEFQTIEFLPMPGHTITYASTKRRQKWQMLLQTRKILILIKKERAWINDLIAKRRIDGIISDNRFGCFHPQVPSVLITHQLAIQSPFGKAGNLIARKMNYRLLKPFSACWVPDTGTAPGLAGKLSHPEKFPLTPVRYIGPLSRMNIVPEPVKYALLLLLSGPEPQRTLLENILKEKLKDYSGSILLIRGIPDSSRSRIYREGNFDVLDYASAAQLEIHINSAELIVCRSGYTTVMDLAALGKKALLIPTPGQPEQEYLAAVLHEQGFYKTTTQEAFSATDLSNPYPGYPGLKGNQFEPLLTAWINRISE